MRQIARFGIYVGLLTLSLLPMACGTAPPPPVQSCEPATEGCACIDGKCKGTLVCTRGICASYCTKENCYCAASRKCDDGLKCQAGYCTVPPCKEGNGCQCGEKGKCDDGLICSSGFCGKPPTPGKTDPDPDPICGDGKDNCRCDKDGKCNSPSYRCYRGYCTDKNEIPGGGTCKPGVKNCPCTDKGVCDDSDAICRRGYCEPKPPGGPDCTGAKANCPCRQDGSCDNPLACVRGFCESECIKKGCQCYRSGKCEAGLECLLGYCSKPVKKDQTCPKPEAGCKCVAAKCEAGLTCQTGYCEPGAGCKDTDTGKKGCPCKPNGTCNTDFACGSSGRCFDCKGGTQGCPCRSGANACDANLKCKNNLCLSCQGEEGCACLANDRCLPGMKCVAKGTQKQCSACSGDYEGCSCRESADCLTKGLACQAGFCRKDLSNDPNGRCTPTVPKNPTCYTPCETNVDDGSGGIIFCHPKYKLREKCLKKQVCDKGSCVVSGQSTTTGYPNCKADTDCPNWQACIQGRCYSNCQNDADCCGGMRCYRYVCRMPCSTTSSICTKEEVCETQSQDKGYCVPRSKPNPTAKPLRRNVGTFSLSTSLLAFNNYTLELEVRITNNSKYPMSFYITPQSDTFARKQPTLLEKKPENPYPLYWYRYAACAKDGTTCSQWNSLSSELACKTKDSNGKCIKYDIYGTSQKYKINSIGKGATRLVKIHIDKRHLPAVDFSRNPKKITEYQGVLEVGSEKMGSQDLTVTYRRVADGQWSGTMYSFGNFDENNIKNVASGNLTTIRNAFLRQWIQFKTEYQKPNGTFPLDEFEAILTSIEKGTWNRPAVIKKCEADVGKVDGARCFLYKNSAGMKVLSDNISDRPIPSATTDMNLAINLKEETYTDPKTQNTVTGLKGRIDTDRSLQYPGNATISITFSDLPSGSPGQSKNFQQIKSFYAKIILGGRYFPTGNKDCTKGLFEEQEVPWLIPGFKMGTIEKKGVRLRRECRSENYPFGKTSKELIAKNVSLSQANPIPNGLVLQRELELVDGAMLSQDKMFIIYREKFKSFFSTGKATNNPLAKDFISYGYIMLTRSTADLEPNDFKGSNVTVKSCTLDSECSGSLCVQGICQSKDELTQVGCTDAVIQKAIGPSEGQASLTSKDKLKNLVDVLIDGVSSSQKTVVLKDKDTKAHYYCKDKDHFNGGPLSESCPVGSNVVFFLYDETKLNLGAGKTLKTHDCHTNPSVSCLSIWQSLERDKQNYQADPTKVCSGDKQNQVYCDTDRTNLKRYYDFLVPDPKQPKGYVSPYQPLQAAIADAFRYRIKFRSRTGKQIGFTPEICVPNSNAVPYCYNPKEVEDIEQRANCLLFIFTKHLSTLNKDQVRQNKLRDFLRFSFSYKNDRKDPGGNPITDFGFETLNAELKIMLGDDAFVKASASRFDLAGSNLYSFAGDELEPNGIRLSGALGYEMYNLYLATQYYQVVLDRFFSMAPAIYESFQKKDTDRFIQPEAVTSYFQKLIRASTQKARALSEIAQRYHNLREPELARHVARRAYASSFIESIIMNRLIRELLQATAKDQKYKDLLPQIRLELERASITYKASFLDLNKVYRELLNDINIFGFSLDYIPFPAVENNTSNAFKVAFDFAKQKMLTAKEKERIALQSQRSFDIDNVSFQNELIKIEQNYENQLVEICGTLTDPATNKVYPAIAKYAYLNKRATELVNPCGWMGNGQLYNARAELDKAKVSFQSLILMQKNTLQQITTEKERIRAQCKANWELSEFKWEINRQKNDLQKQMRSAQGAISAANRTFSLSKQIATLTKCTPPGATSAGDCVFGALGKVIIGAAAVARDSAVTTLEKKIRDKQSEIGGLDQKVLAKKYDIECGPKGLYTIDSGARIRNLRNSMMNHELEALKSHYQIRIALSNIKQLQDKATRLVAQQDESAQLAINLQAAKNDPNVRIYKNDSILTAEKTFEIAIREAYRTTLVYEYYTGTSYKDKIKLFLTRMVTSGTYNLEDYLTQLELAYRQFLEDNGVPDTRVAVYSLRDDILKIARTRKDGKPLTIEQRISTFRQNITSPGRINSEGFVSFPFDISVDKGTSKVSPITVNHKIFYVEAEIIGGSIGDSTGRLYLRQKGTSWVRLPKNKFEYYTLPQRIAVINPFFNGVKSFNPTVYQNYRLRDRPLANSHWELLLNQLSEQVNQDIDLNSLDDIRLYVYYKDFTEGN